MVVKINSEKVSVTNEGNSYFLDYGILRQGVDTKIDLEVITNIPLTFHSTCGCTIPTMIKTNGGYEGSIIYDSKRMGGFGKTVTITGTNTSGSITLRGTVIK